MPPRLSPLPKSGGFHPSNDKDTYRDLLLFENRLKTNAASLNRRKRRYLFFLAQLLLIILFLLSEVLLQSNLLSRPYAWLLRRALPDIYGPDAEIRVHRYLALGLLCVAVTTLALFFLSGMYSEKIGYANKYVPHANRALRSLNMYLNVRQPPLRSKLPFNPFALLFPRPAPSSPPPPPAANLEARRRSPSPPRLAGGAVKRSSSVPIAPIPPSSNPRGELIFSSRVDRSFREAYERYRSAFERRREEREREEYAATWLGWICVRVLRIGAAGAGAGPASVAAGAGGGGGSGTATPVARTGSLGSVRGRGSPAGTPNSSRRSSPVPRKTRRSSLIGASSLSASSSTAEPSEPVVPENNDVAS